MKPERAKTLRCAVYTRVSTEHGLEQEFNSLDNQREAAEAYVRSQAHEGWRLLPARYDDGGYSGASMERPGLQRLLSDIKSGRTDIVVVYKVDRLTRSLADFAKLVELFDAHSVSFVSVTQAFNTTSSMGRLTLNVLLSFAQFEREVTGERIRDKIAASKRKGLWMGGVVPLGYRVETRKLVVHSEEAETVRLIFERYLALGSLPALQQELRGRGVLTRARTHSSGQVVGGVPLTNGPLAYMLRNRMYLGEINHKGQSHPGEHDAIIAPDLFASVQDTLSSNRNGHRRKRVASQALLLGRIFDDRGHPMTPSYAVKNGARYRYYVSCVLAQGRKDEAGTVSRVPAPELEREVAAALGASGDIAGANNLLLADRLGHVVVTVDRLEIHVRAAESEHEPAAPIVVPWRAPGRSRHRGIEVPKESASKSRWAHRKVIRPEARARLLEAIAKARLHVDRILTGDDGEIDRIAAEEGCSERSVRMNLNLAFLSPEVVKAAVEGTLPHGFGVSVAVNFPACWWEQAKTPPGALYPQHRQPPEAD